MGEESTQLSFAGIIDVICIRAGHCFIVLIAEVRVFGDCLNEAVVGVKRISLFEEFVEFSLSKMLFDPHHILIVLVVFHGAFLECNGVIVSP
jgi:hypothetical protein